MRRSLLAFLILLALSSTSGRTALSPVDAGPPQGFAQPEAQGPAAFGPETIAAILEVVNPRLSESQRDRIAAAVIENSAKYELDPELVTAVMWEESDVRPWARSPKGAVGLMQVMPHMSTQVPLAGNLTTIEKNVELGCLILADNIRRWGLEDGISAYFWGSDIRGASYLNRVLEKRASVARLADS